MSITIHLDENQSTRLSEQVIETHPPNRIEFVAVGIITMTEGLLGEFGRTTLRPTRVDLSVDESHTVPVDLTEQASLRLENVDVGVETPDADDISPGLDSLDPTTDESAESPDITPVAIAFTAEGAILNVPEATVEQLSERALTLKSITFAVDDALKSDGGSNNDVLLEVTLLGYGIVIHHNGMLEIGTRGDVTDIGLS